MWSNQKKGAQLVFRLKILFSLDDDDYYYCSIVEVITDRFLHTQLS